MKTYALQHNGPNSGRVDFRVAARSLRLGRLELCLGWWQQEAPPPTRFYFVRNKPSIDRSRATTLRLWRLLIGYRIYDAQGR